MPETGGQNKPKVLTRAEQALPVERRKAKTRAELIALFKRFHKLGNHRIRMLHRAGEGGVAVARRRSDLLDTVLRNLVDGILNPEGKAPESVRFPFTLVAVGGYGRGTLSPGSDVDLLFLCPGSTSSLNKATVDMIGDILTMLYDMGFKVGHAVRSIKESIRLANSDNPTKTAMLDTRLILGDERLYQRLVERFQKECIVGREAEYLEVRRKDFLARHQKHGKTVYLQEPHLKEGCGGLRDYQNILWVTRVKFGYQGLEDLVENRMLSRSAYRAMTKAYDFLMRVRNELHWSERPCTDQLTLRLQGVVATNLGYPERSMLRRIEVFMRDYYRHTRALYMHSTSLMQAFRLLQEEERSQGIVSFLARRKGVTERFDGFYSRQDLIFPESPEIFAEDPERLMRLFRHTQQRGLRLSPALRKLVKKSRHLVNKTFRYSKANRVVFLEILGARGEVGRTLRQMHRVGFLGKYLPEFGALDCLVQHEFFHRFTADEHTLRCVEILDSLTGESDPRLGLYAKLFHEMEDAAVMVLALLLHDTGRAENVRYHSDASTSLAQRVGRRLQLSGTRRKLLLFLVDNHLTFWRTATGKNLEDTETIAEFASVMQGRSNMEALLLFTHVDSRATNEDSWTAWKEMLMLQLYRSTCAYMEDTGIFRRSLEESREELRGEVRSRFEAGRTAEIDLHFAQMPERYFQFGDAEAVARHIGLFRRFIEHTTATTGLESLHPVVEWISNPASGYTQLEICCWDRSHLLAKIAGALAAEEINILGADLFTRGDNLVLDIFRICNTNFEPVRSLEVQKRVETLVNQLLDETVDWTLLGQRFPLPKADDDELVRTFPSRIFFSNDSNSRYTVLEVQTLDRLGLLYELFRVFGSHGIEVSAARVLTEKGAAIDTFYLTDRAGRKLQTAGLQAVRQDMERALGIPGAGQVPGATVPRVTS
jgi:[protein-PII] uridylyltransferase